MAVHFYLNSVYINNLCNSLYMSEKVITLSLEENLSLIYLDHLISVMSILSYIKAFIFFHFLHNMAKLLHQLYLWKISHYSLSHFITKEMENNIIHYIYQ